jgi:hypothetical protein
MALESFEQIMQGIADDDEAVSLFDELLKAAECYFLSVVGMESRLKMAGLRLGGQAFQGLFETMHRRRSAAYDALVSARCAFNRHLSRRQGKEASSSGTCFGDPKTTPESVAMDDWAGALLCTLYRGRKR